MRALVVLALVSVSFAVPFASADCTVVSPSFWPDVNYTTVCALHEGSYGDGTQTFEQQYVAHVSHAVEADPVFDYAYLRVDQGSWTYDDGEVFHEREVTHVGVGAFEGVRGVAGGGVHANLVQRAQTAGEDEGDACSSFVGESTCLGAGGWLTLQDVGGVGAGVYYQQTGTGGSCEEKADVYVTAGIVFVPVVNDPQPCAMQMPSFYDEVPFGDLPLMP